MQMRNKHMTHLYDQTSSSGREASQAGQQRVLTPEKQVHKSTTYVLRRDEKVVTRGLLINRPGQGDCLIDLLVAVDKVLSSPSEFGGMDISCHVKEEAT